MRDDDDEGTARDRSAEPGRHKAGEGRTADDP